MIILYIKCVYIYIYCCIYIYTVVYIYIYMWLPQNGMECFFAGHEQFIEFRIPKDTNSNLGPEVLR